MSASLVGSEMCIRDRHRTSHFHNLAGLRDQLTKEARRGGQQAATGEGGSCLLYTSDAADDM
eukprot:4843217-Alexandrium_andersonii.AAC.1